MRTCAGTGTDRTGTTTAALFLDAAAAGTSDRGDVDPLDPLPHPEAVKIKRGIARLLPEANEATPTRQTANRAPPTTPHTSDSLTRPDARMR
jgi:hypothetical protein